MFLDLDDCINSNLSMLFIEFLLFSFSLSYLNNDNKKILLEGRYFISEVLTLDSEQHADIICKSSGVWAIIFLKYFLSIKIIF